MSTAPEKKQRGYLILVWVIALISAILLDRLFDIRAILTVEAVILLVCSIMSAQKGRAEALSRFLQSYGLVLIILVCGLYILHLDGLFLNVFPFHLIYRIAAILNIVFIAITGTYAFGKNE